MYLTVEELKAKYAVPDSRVDDTLLAGLSTVNWKELSHAHGEASDIPALLRGAVSQNEYDRGFSFALLHETIWHQGTIYEATRYAVPFLINLLDNPETPEKMSIVLLLWAISKGHPCVSENNKWLKEYYAQQGIDFQTAVQESIKDVRLAREAVERGLDNYISLLEDDDYKLRWYVIPLLLAFPEASTRTLSVIHSRIIAETNDVIRAKMIETTAEFMEKHSLGEEKFAFLKLFESLESAENESFLIRYVAGKAIITLAPERATKSMIQKLLETIALPHRANLLLENNPNTISKKIEDGFTVDKIARALSCLEKPDNVFLLIKSLSLVNTPEYAHSVAVSLLNLALLDKVYQLKYTGRVALEDNGISFGEILAENRVPKRTYPVLIENLETRDLTAVQEAVIKIILHDEQVWRIPSNLLEMYGLPLSRTEAIEKL
jgi:hypothetical protein